MDSLMPSSLSPLRSSSLGSIIFHPLTKRIIGQVKPKIRYVDIPRKDLRERIPSETYLQVNIQPSQLRYTDK